MSKPETLCLSEIGFCTAKGLTTYSTGADNPMLAELSRMGITYFRFMHDRFMDCLWLFNCRNVPDDLPDWLERVPQQASDFVGKSAMTQLIADQIKEQANESRN